MQRGAQENLWPKFFLGRPVARHFVWDLISTWRAVRNPLKIQAAWMPGFVGIAQSRERFTSVRCTQRRGRNACGKEQTAESFAFADGVVREKPYEETARARFAKRRSFVRRASQEQENRLAAARFESSSEMAEFPL
jgi:hypothetical protein